MQIKDFTNKVVVCTSTKKRMYLYDIKAPSLTTVTVEPDKYGHHTFYSWPTINGDPFKNGYLVFEEEGLLEQFIKLYDEYSRTEDAYWENYEYWFRRE